MRYGSLCSGIEAATVAWHPLGFEPVFFSEIDKSASRVLAHHYPNVPNHGDMTKFQEWPDHAIDLLVGGTPCQSFSVAGLRKGMADPRGNLALTYLAVAGRYRPRRILWENVPGVLSSNGGRDFGAFLGGLGELGYGWAYRVLDAQYVRVDGFGRAVPQRRRRVFVVGDLGGWQRAAAVLFERESLCWHSPPRREAGQVSSRDVASGLVSSGRGVERTGETRGQDPVVGVMMPEIANPLTARMHKGVNTTMDEGQTMVGHALRAEGFDASEDGTGRGTPLVPVVFDSKGTEVQFDETGGAPTLRSMGHANAHQNAGGQLAVAFDLRGREGGAQFEGPHATANVRAASGGSSRSYVSQAWAVRRLTPVECERLQGFPDGYTDVLPPKKNQAPDGPRYKQLGNSMAVNVMRWIGTRMVMVDEALGLTIEGRAA